MTRKFSKHQHATYGTLNSCFDFIGSHQQCIPLSPPQNVETELLPMGHQFMPHISDAKPTSQGKNAQSH